MKHEILIESASNNTDANSQANAIMLDLEARNILTGYSYTSTNNRDRSVQRVDIHGVAYKITLGTAYVITYTK